VRIVAGRHRGRPLAAPEGRDLRPTADRVREAVFDALCHGNARIGEGDAVRDAIVLDAFAGTGGMGLEAASRGAAHVTLMELDNAALRLSRRNVASLGEQDRVTVLGGDCLNPVRAAPAQKTGPCDLVFLDPPYRSGLAETALTALARAGWIAPGALCVVELAAKEPFTPPDGFTLLDERRYGAARVVFVQWAGGASPQG
jgi:16S rRNA (guanine966-N2)-methyltransferase